MEQVETESCGKWMNITMQAHPAKLKNHLNPVKQNINQDMAYGYAIGITKHNSVQLNSYPYLVRLKKQFFPHRKHRF